MGQVTIQEFTTKNPISMIGMEAGICWGADTSDQDKNYKRGMGCLKSGHGRTFEFPDVYMILNGYSARVIREFYTHIGGAPTRLQASTRYIDYADNGFEYIDIPSIEKNEDAKRWWSESMHILNNRLRILEESFDIPKEDVANGLPLGMTTKIVVKINSRTLIDMSRQRMCSRAYWEFRQLFRDIYNALKNYSEEWDVLVTNHFMAKCEVCGFCEEARSCGRRPKKTDFFNTYNFGKTLLDALEKEGYSNPTAQEIIDALKL